MYEKDLNVWVSDSNRIHVFTIHQPNKSFYLTKLMFQQLAQLSEAT